jgi:hypothetical protein
MQKIGSYYNWSKKYSFYIPPKKALFYLTLSILNGLLFERIIFGWDVSPFLTVILKFVFAISCFFISKLTVDDMVIPNRRVVYFIALLVSFISWYTLWAFAMTRFDESSFFFSLFHPFKVLIFFAKVQEYQASPLFPDTMAFFVSIMIIYDDPDFFIRIVCQNCNNYYYGKKLYFPEGESFLEELEQSQPGKYQFIRQRESIIEDNILDEKAHPDAPYTFIKAILYCCDKCHKDYILTISKGTKYCIVENDTSTINTRYTSTKFTQIYIDDITAQILEEKYNKSWQINKDHLIPHEEPNHTINIEEEHQDNTDENTINFNDIHNK